MYVRKFFHKNSKAAILEIVDGIRYEFEGILSKASWMDEKTRQSAIAKLTAMTAHIGYPDELLDNSVIDAYYKDLQMHENNYFLANLIVSKFESNQKLGVLRKPSNRNDWINYERTTTVNAFYSPHKNSISKKMTSCCLQNNRKTKLSLSFFFGRIPGWNFTRSILFS